MAHPLLDALLTSGATALAGAVAIAQDIPIAPKEVGLAAIVMAIGAWMVKSHEKSSDKVTAAIERNSEAQVQVGSTLSLLMKEISEARKDTDEKRRAMLAALEDLPEQVAEKVRRTA